MVTPRPQPVPAPTLRRLPSYLRLLQQLPGDQEWVSCTFLSDVLERDATQVRKDLGFTGVVGRPKVGFRAADLRQAIERLLGWDSVSEALIAGVGNLGTALLGYGGFARHGLRIALAFDADPAKTGTRVHDVTVQPIRTLPSRAAAAGIRMGIITAPASCAQSIADLMVLGGVEAIWNFAPAPLSVPPTVLVGNEHLSATLAVLSSRLTALHPRGPSPRGPRKVTAATDVATAAVTEGAK